MWLQKSTRGAAASEMAANASMAALLCVRRAAALVPSAVGTNFQVACAPPARAGRTSAPSCAPSGLVAMDTTAPQHTTKLSPDSPDREPTTR